MGEVPLYPSLGTLSAYGRGPLTNWRGCELFDSKTTGFEPFDPETTGYKPFDPEATGCKLFDLDRQSATHIATHPKCVQGYLAHRKTPTPLAPP